MAYFQPSNAPERLAHMLPILDSLARQFAVGGMNIHYCGTPIDVKDVLREEAEQWFEDNKDVIRPKWVVYASHPKGLDYIDDQILFDYFQGAFLDAEEQDAATLAE